MTSLIKTEKPVGVLTAFPKDRVVLTRFHCPESLAPFVEHFWMVCWDLRGLPPFVSENLPHPSVNLSIEKTASQITGVMKGKFIRRLEGKGSVFAVKFLPGGFYPFYNKPVSALCNRVIDPAVIWGKPFTALAAKIIAAQKPEVKIRLMEKFLLGLKPVADPQILFLNRLLKKIRDDRSIASVERLSEFSGTGTRNLQRLFSTYAGISPKWIIRRYRLHEAVERLKTGKKINLVGLAYELGYADQAHFIRDFRNIVGATPANYARLVNTSSKTSRGKKSSP
ncbi:MAG: AraC family transcriptional regulator [Bacteroidetes bacterium]|nr:MAG: AraC family transcriptional regulator [Bacteroidota bacterium]